MNNQLEDLRLKLASAMSSSFSSADQHPEPLFAKQLEKLRRRYSRVLPSGDKRSIRDAMRSFRLSGALESRREIKLTCVGASTEFSGWCLLGDSPLLMTLLNTVQVSPERARMRYLSYLLHSYWSFARNSDATSKPSLDGWMKLRSWLNVQRQVLALLPGLKQPWFETLNDHANLLTAEPCARYARDLLAGTSRTMEDVFEKLFVPANSWLREESILAQMWAAANQEDTGFKSLLGRLVEIAIGRASIRVSDCISKRCLALLLSRYAACSTHPELISLRDAAIAVIGNPWLRRAGWDAYVLDNEGRADTRAREMVDAWLKVRLIKDFFGLLSEDRNADDRRLQYWLRFEPVIEDMWFGLGFYAMTHKGNEYNEFRRRASGRLLELAGPDPRNNAFIMRIGGFLVVEFGLTDNACFIYHNDRLPIDISSKVDMGGRIEIDVLKCKTRDLRLLHVGPWEQEFDSKICRLIGFWPPRFSTLRPARNSAGEPPDFVKFVSLYGLETDDRSKNGGCIWVLTDDTNPRVFEALTSWGFTYRRGKGWWRRGSWQGDYFCPAATVNLAQHRALRQND